MNDDDCCMCGNNLSNPQGCYAEGHSPVPMKSYYVSNGVEYWDDNYIPEDYFDLENQTEERTDTMSQTNYSTAVMLFNPNIRAVKVVYEPTNEKTAQQSYTFKTLDDSIKTDDLVIIPTDTRFGFTVVKVVETDVEVDFESNQQLKWIAGRFDPKSYAYILQEEQNMIDTMKKAQIRKKREEMANNLKEMYEGAGIENSTLLKLSALPPVDVVAEAVEEADDE